MIFKKKKASEQRERQQANEGQRVYTYYTASKSQIDKFERSNSARESKNKVSSKPLGSKILTILAIGFSLFIIVYMITLSSNPSIKIEGQKDYNNTEFYQNTIKEAISKDKRNLLKMSLQSEAAESDIKNAIPEAVKVNVDAPLIGRAPVVKITTVEPFAVLIQKNSPSYIIDSRGKVVVDINKTAIDTKSLPTLNNESGLDYKLGDQVFKPDEMLELNKLNYQLSDGSKVISYVLPETPREVRVNRGGYFVKFSLDDSSGADSVQQYGALFSIEKSIKEQGTIAPKEYIDVRLGDKVYVK